MKQEKTNVMRILDMHKIEYKSYCYIGTNAVSGVEVAEALNQNEAQVFKTLVTIGHSREHYVFVIPVAKELDLKKAAKAVGEALAKRALEKGITEVCFDRGGYLYHGRVKELADGAREAGLKF